MPAGLADCTLVRRILGYALLPVLVVLALPSAIRLFGDHGWAPLVLVDVITPYVVPLLVVLLVAFAILNRSILTGVAGVLVIINIAWLLPLFVGSSAGQGEALTVVTANLHVGHADPVAVVELLRRQHADVLAAEVLTPTEVTALDRARAAGPGPSVVAGSSGSPSTYCAVSATAPSTNRS